MKTSELRKALESVKPGLARREMLEQSMSVIFRQDHLFTFNDEVAVVARLESGVTGAVPAEPLYRFLSKLPDDQEVRIEEAENELRFSSGRNRAGIMRDEEVKLPLDEEVPEPEEWCDLPDGFLQALRRVLFSAAQGGHRPILTCVHVTEEYMETCDGFRMTRCDYRTEEAGDLKVVARNLEKLPGYGPTRFGFSDNWAQFLNEAGVRYCVRLVDGDYPDLDRFLEVAGGEIEFPEGLEDALEWASVVADDSVKYKQHVDVSISKGKLVVKGEGPDGWAEKEVRMRYSGEPIEFQAHPVLLREMAKLARRVVVGKDCLKIEADGFAHVVSLGSQDGEGE